MPLHRSKFWWGSPRGAAIVVFAVTLVLAPTTAFAADATPAPEPAPVVVAPVVAPEPVVAPAPAPATKPEPAPAEKVVVKVAPAVTATPAPAPKPAPVATVAPVVAATPAPAPKPAPAAVVDPVAATVPVAVVKAAAVTTTTPTPVVTVTDTYVLVGCDYSIVEVHETIVTENYKWDAIKSQWVALPPTSVTIVDTKATTKAEALANGWTLPSSCTPTPITVTPAPPTFADKDGTAADTVTVPATVGVEYKLNGNTRAAAPYPAVGSVSVVAVALPGFTLAGVTSWTHLFTDVVVTPPPVAPPVVAPVVAPVAIPVTAKVVVKATPTTAKPKQVAATKTVKVASPSLASTGFDVMDPLLVALLAIVSGLALTTRVRRLKLARI